MLLTGSALAAYWLTALVVMATPGVTVSSLVGTTLSSGMRAGFAMEIGANLARFSMMTALALGLSVIAAFMSEAFVYVKLLGAVYLVWLGLRAFRHPPHLEATRGAPPGFGAMVLRGFLVLWSNPKAFLFAGALVPQFVVADAPLVPQLAFLGLIWIGTATVTDSLYILLSERIRTWLTERAGRAIGWVSGSVLIGAALWLATSQKA
ncbi:MAG: LysE family translocator [Alphaproteobacteria bacterium]|nr:LysE family translocator [Alphaproteobacteria bacterium]